VKIEEMETVLSAYIKKRSAALGQPVRQEICLVREDIGIKVNDSAIEIGLSLIKEGISLEVLVDRIINLDWQLLHQARKEKARLVEKEKQLAKAHICELQRLCTVEDFDSFLDSFKLGKICKR